MKKKNKENHKLSLILHSVLTTMWIGMWCGFIYVVFQLIDLFKEIPSADFTNKVAVMFLILFGMMFVAITKWVPDMIEAHLKEVVKDYKQLK